MITLRLIITLMCVALLQACAPISTNYTARTLGQGNWDVSAGSSFPDPAQPYVRISRGMTDNLDVGVVGEAGDGVVGGAWAKYAFVNNPDKWSFAATGGTGYAYQGLYVYAGSIVSYKYKWYEPYINLRGVYNTNNIYYGQLTLGNNIWFTDQFGLNLNINELAGNINTVVGSAGLIYRF